MKMIDVITIVRETGVVWVFNRVLYMMKIKMLNIFPRSEKIFEKKVNIRRIDIFDLDIVSIEKFIAKLSIEEKQEIIGRAEMALDGKIMAFSNIPLNYGAPIEWQKNPMTGICIDKQKKWYTIPDFDESRGDIKVVWEISRFSHLYFFLRAYMITKEEKYYKGFVKQIGQWLQENSYSYGANFKCGQECALRIMNVLTVYGGFLKYGLITKDVKKLVMQFVEVNYRKILSNFFYAHRCVKIDHLISELCGMIIGAWCSQDSRRVKKYFAMLNEQILEQFNEKGMYVSYSFNYQRYVMQMIEYMIKLQPKLEVDFSKEAKKRIINAVILYEKVMGNDGIVPNYGPNDGTLIFPVSACQFRDFRPIVYSIWGLLKEECFYDYGDYCEEYLWFSNRKEPLEKRKELCFKENIDGAGFYLLENNEVKVFVNAHEYERRPGHMDQLHLELWIKGKNIFCDTGTYSYALELGEYLRGNEGHNVVSIEGKEQMKRMGHFLNYAMPKISILKRTEDEIDCKAEFRTGYNHNRKVKLENNIITIKDRVTSKNSKKKYNILFHTAYSVRKNGRKVDIYDLDNTVICTLESEGGEIVIEKSFASYYYLDKQEISLINISCSEECNQVIIEVKD